MHALSNGSEAKLRLRGDDGCVEICILDVEWPELGNHEQNPFTLSLSLDSQGFSGSFTYGHYLHSLHVFVHDIERMIAGQLQEVVFPSPTLRIRDIHTHLELRINEDKCSQTGWTLFFAFGTPHIWDSPLHPPRDLDSNDLFAGLVAVRFTFWYECLAAARETIVDYLRSLGPRQESTDAR
jgi:hypothetical protein